LFHQGAFAFHMKKIILIACHLLLASLLPCRAGLNTVYFVMTSHFPPMPAPWTNYQDSFVVPLERLEDIAYARQLIQNPNDPNLKHGHTIMATFAVGRDGINRNYSAVGAPEWNWHIVDFVWFTDSGDSEVRAVGLEWIANHEGDLEFKYQLPVFFKYHFSAELGPALYLALRSEGDQMIFQWSSPPYDSARPYYFTLEWTPKLNPPHWQPLPGIPWPLQTNQWSLPKSNVSSAFYRVKAQL
jgi:hypothetical protein